MEHYIRAIAGMFILLSVALGWFVHRYWFFFTAFVGINLLQSAFTNWCLMENILAKLGVQKGYYCRRDDAEPSEDEEE